MKNKEIIFKELLELKDNSYSPYSKFKVACIIYLKNGEVIKGVNVENASYPAGICGERTALSQLYTLGYTKEDVDSIALYTDSISFGSPCGVCRQVMAELLRLDQVMMIFNQSEFVSELKVEDLLPYAFKPEQLSK